jgi:hypothetical protein
VPLRGEWIDRIAERFVETGTGGSL